MAKCPHTFILFFVIAYGYFHNFNTYESCVLLHIPTTIKTNVCMCVLVELCWVEAESVGGVSLWADLHHQRCRLSRQRALDWTWKLQDLHLHGKERWAHCLVLFFFFLLGRYTSAAPLDLHQALVSDNWAQNIFWVVGHTRPISDKIPSNTAVPPHTLTPITSHIWSGHTALWAEAN